MRRLEIAAKSDRGRMRPRNEDAYYTGEGVFAVADGMGGHLAGDVASATALLPVRSLDGRVFADAATAQAALLDAILAANAAVVRKAANEPGLHGMGTTLTATIVEGRRLHVGHVGDSRAYLFRDGQLSQLTRDHTLVAHLIEEGQITAEEAAVHPQRSIITRAIGVDVDLEVDTLTIDLVPGDQVLLCSDGLTGPVSDAAIAETLSSDAGSEMAVDRLVEQANEAGGPDNITVVLLRFHDEDGSESAIAPTIIRTGPDGGEDASEWVSTLGRYGAGRADGRDDEPAENSRAQRVIVAAIVALALLAGAALGGRWLLSRSFWVGADEGTVTIFRGIPASLGPLALYWEAETTDVELADVAQWYRPQLEDGIAAADLADARRIVENAPRASDTPSPSPTTTTSPTPSPSPTA